MSFYLVPSARKTCRIAVYNIMVYACECKTIIYIIRFLTEPRRIANAHVRLNENVSSRKLKIQLIEKRDYRKWTRLLDGSSLHANKIIPLKIEFDSEDSSLPLELVEK